MAPMRPSAPKTAPMAIPAFAPVESEELEGETFGEDVVDVEVEDCVELELEVEVELLVGELETVVVTTATPEFLTFISNIPEYALAPPSSSNLNTYCPAGVVA